MSATEDTSRLFRAMGLERKAGDYKELGPLTRAGRIAAFDEGALPMMAAVARSLDESPAEPAPGPTVAAPSSPVLSPAAPPVQAVPLPAAGAERLSPLMASLKPAVPPAAAPQPSAEIAAAVPPVASALSKVFERYAAPPAEAVPASPVAGTPLKPLFDRLR